MNSKKIFLRDDKRSNSTQMVTFCVCFSRSLLLNIITILGSVQRNFYLNRRNTFCRLNIIKLYENYTKDSPYNIWAQGPVPYAKSYVLKYQ